MEKVVLDTNVLVDGLRDEHSSAWKIIDKIFSGEIELYTSFPLEREYRRILQREINDSSYASRIRDLLEIANKIEVHNIQRLVKDDPEDDKVLATAISADVQTLISEDRHLLDLDPFGKLRIMKTKEYLNIKEQDSSWGDFARMIGIK